MKKREIGYLIFAIIIAEFVIIFPVIFPKHQSSPDASAEASVRVGTSPFPPRAIDTAPPERPRVANVPVPMPVAKTPHVLPVAAVPRSTPRPKERMPAHIETRKPAAPIAARPLPKHVAVVTSPRAATAAPTVPLQSAPHPIAPSVKPSLLVAKEPARAAYRPPAPLQVASRMVTPLEQRSPQALAQMSAAAIFQYDATATHLLRGQKTFLCVGLDSGVSASIAGVGRIAAGETTCHRIAPQRTTTYVLTVERNGVIAKRTVRVSVKQAPSTHGERGASKPRHRRFEVPE